ncbi:MAG TPA: c-type cytochrome domain-containing protein [Planctomycetaceae bacterium]|nr:c-type cytochrome domain-containing protein [Planctomycetaceae bacterium]
MTIRRSRALRGQPLLPPRSRWLVFGAVAGLLVLLPGIVAAGDKAADAAKKSSPVSYYRHVRPILQRSCSGCHQAAKRGGGLLLTSYEGLKKGGEAGPGFVVGKPDESTIVQYVSGDKPEMPKSGEKLKPAQVDSIRNWIAQGAKDDTPEGVKDPVTVENPPKYASPPVIAALAYSPDSSLLAVSGFHEILLHQADGSKLVGRLIGRAQRIESLAFSPDGKILGAVGGTPALLGEAQFWSVAQKKLALELPVTYDSLYGASFNNDGKLFAFGGADNRARIVRVADGKEVVRFDAHSDYVLGTTFSLKQDYLITVSRDMSMKLIVVENGQFVDNITSITPGALKGGLVAVERHPTREQVLTGGADGEPKLYQIFRTKTRVIGDDFNRIRGYEPLPGRIFSLQFNKDGSQFVVGASTATGGTARIYSTDDGKLLHDLSKISGPVYAVAFRPDGKQVAVAGFEGKVRLYDAASGALVKEFLPVEITPVQTAAR